MKTNKIALSVIVFIVSFFLGFVSGKNYQEKLFEEKTPNASAIFSCDNSKFIIADFFEDNVELRLSDNRIIILPHAISASGARYADKNEVFVFWNKGNTAFIDENNERTFENCLANGSENN